MPDYDVTVSVWNEFYAPELCAGLVKAGNRVLALRSVAKPYPGVRSRTCQSSRLLSRAFRHLGSQALLEGALSSFESFARRHVGQSPVFWGWNGHHLSAFLAARQAGQRVLCERGSTHGAWGARRLARVYRDLGWGPAEGVLGPRERRGLEEYEVADKILVPSRFVERTFLEEGVPANKLQRNPYGVDKQRWYAVEGKTRMQGPMVFVWTAAITARKGGHVMLRAWEQAGLRDAELWMVGGLHLPLRELGIRVADNVRFFGYKSPGELADMYDRASVYVLPSFEEGMARSGIEALASGLPCIVTEETGLTDLMTSGEEGWIVESGNVEQLAETLRQTAALRGALGARCAAARACTANADKADYGARAAGFLREFMAQTI